jgi:exonuclease III
LFGTRHRLCTFFRQRKRADEPRIHGVGFAVKNSILPTIEPLTGGTERLLTLRMATSAGFNFVCVYTPTLSFTTEEKENFYDALDLFVRTIPNNEALFIMGYVNARVDADFEA